MFFLVKRKSFFPSDKASTYLSPIVCQCDCVLQCESLATRLGCCFVARQIIMHTSRLGVSGGAGSWGWDRARLKIRTKCFEFQTTEREFRVRLEWFSIAMERPSNFSNSTIVPLFCLLSDAEIFGDETHM